MGLADVWSIDLIRESMFKHKIEFKSKDGSLMGSVDVLPAESYTKYNEYYQKWFEVKFNQNNSTKKEQAHE